jgi:outer membrane protein assembly complex protein YaeT
MRGKDPVPRKQIGAAILAAGLAVAWLLARGPEVANAQQPPGYAPTLVADVQIVGNHTVFTETILNHLSTKPNKDYVRATVEEDVRKLNQMGSFRNIKVDVFPAPGGKGQDGRDRVIVRFTVTEHPSLVQDVIIKNNRHVKLDDLSSLKQIKKGAPLNPSLNQMARNDIAEEHRKNGYYFAAVTLEEGAKPGDKRVVFNIAEGPFVRVRSIRFEGNDSLASGARLQTQIMSSHVLIPGLRLGGKFVPELVEADLDKLREYYKANGYLKVQVSRELAFSDDQQWVDIAYHLHEGIVYHVKDVTVEGIKPELRSKMESIIQVKSGEVFRTTTAEMDKRNLADIEGYQGYKTRFIENLVYEEPGQVDVHYQVQEEARAPAYVGQIIVQGNKVTKDRVVRRLLTFQPGQLLPYPELRASEENLKRSTLFEVNPQLGIRPTIDVLDDPNNPDSPYKDVVVNVNETYTGAFMVGIGVNSDQGLVGNIVLNERNFDLFRPPTSLADIWEGRAWRGAGQELRLEASPGTQVQRYSAQIREPYLFDLPYSLTVGAYYFDRIFNEYTEGRVGGRFTLGHNFDRNWSIAGSVRIEGINVSNVPFFAPPDYTSVVGEHFLVAPRVTVAYDTRDSYLKPTEGGRVELSYEEAFGDFTFPILNAEANQFFTTFKRRDGSGKQVLALRAQASWEGSNAPVYERFFAGGYRSLRGFAFRGVGPYVDGFNVGGDFMLLTSAEYQIPILASDSLYFVTFVDAGTVERDLSIHDYRVAAGFGARIVVPMMGPVPIALDFGFPIVRGPGDQQQIFSFYVGFFH